MIATAEFESLLNQRFGLDAESIGSSAIARAVQDRLSACNLPNLEAYFQHVSASHSEVQQLIELVVVPETWFFRDAEAFALLAQLALKEWLPAHPEGVLRLLSLPCSTGEEAYSMAIALFDMGIPGNRFSIDAVDISARALTRARQAFYGKNSFRSRDLGFRDCYFKTTADGSHLNGTVSGQVHFQAGNLIDDGLLPGSETYDFIFCRNLLIYFDQAMQQRSVKALLRLLKTGGVLFVGPSETALMANPHFTSMKTPLAFAFRKIDAPALKSKKTGASPPTIKPSSINRPSAVSRTRANSLPRKSIAPPQPANIEIDEALRFADQGRLGEAAERCEEFMQAHGPSAKAFYLLGLVRDASGESQEAAALYRKALYLDPQHREALIHLALILDKQGDTAAAKVLNERASRVEQKGQK
jgi:chemotaxis protein methyltransferase WspC